MSRTDCSEWWDANAPADAPPLARSSCVGCPYHSSGEWLYMADNFPEMTAEAAALEADCNAKAAASGSDYQFYLHNKCVPLDVALAANRTDREWARKQGSLFGDDGGWDNECEGMCGS